MQITFKPEYQRRSALFLARNRRMKAMSVVLCCQLDSVEARDSFLC